MKIILASSSIFRRQLLSKLGVPFDHISPDIDEARLKGEIVKDYVKRLSIQKAFKVAQDQSNAIASQRKSQIGSGDRSERIRTYNFPQGRVTDHRINLTLYKLEEILNGDLEEIINGLISAERLEAMSSYETDNEK